MDEKLLMPLNSYRIRWIFSCLFVLFSVPDARFNPLAQSSKLVSVSFSSVSSFFNEPSDFIVSFIDLFQFCCFATSAYLLFSLLFLLLLTVVDEMCFFFNFGTATNVWFDGLRGISLRAGVPCSSDPSKRPAVAKNRDTARQAAVSTERP